MTAPLVGLTGRKRAGKDTFAAVLTGSHGYVRASFADPLREAALRMDPIVHHDDHLGEVHLSDLVEGVGWEYAKDHYPEVRRILQTLGTDAIRALDPEFWVRNAVGKLDPNTPTVFTDVRFPNEADAIRDLGGIVVRIERQLPDDGDVHPSETALDDYEVDATVTDDGTRTVEDLREAAEAFAVQVSVLHAIGAFSR